ncbi:MAG: molybdopterin molybdotransferase MoeA [Arcanobacterium sp.]|nr:molybdopterin molybdotransferase MoeA [Arcanobacterium sp.]MDY5589275.1 molybdopterin molybdotransferase MoeA [Arcanobacterium sp.]
MKSVADFLDRCVEVSAPLPPLGVSLAGAAGCVLAETVHAAVNVPAHDVADGDGYAVLASDIEQASADHPIRLAVIDSVNAASVSAGSIVPGGCVQVASGAPLPSGADAVVPVAFTDHGTATVQVKRAVMAGSYVRHTGEDARAGEELLPAGVRLSARHLALLAAEGHASAMVHPSPRVVIVAVGDELQEPGRPARAGKVFDATSHALASAVRDAGGNVFRVGVVSDEKRVLRETLEDQLVRADIIITTGGLSYSGGDSVKEVLASFGSVRFDAVALWPGRQLGVGVLNEEAAVFCLPGNPVAALTAFEIFIRPALRHMAGYSQIHRRPITARLTAAWPGHKGLEDYVPVRAEGNPRDGYRATPLVPTATTLMSAFAHANGLAVLPPELGTVSEGEQVQCIILDL